MTTVIIIPARLESTRLLNKLLLKETGCFLLQHTWESARKSGFPVYIASDSDIILEEAKKWGSLTIRTRSDHQNGTSRIVEAKESLKDADLIINVQGDFPNVQKEDLLELEQFMRRGRFSVGTLATFLEPFEANLKDVVKVTIYDHRALYFSRAPLAGALKHVGVYAYWKETLNLYKEQELSPLGKAEQLEQITWLERGEKIGVVIIKNKVFAIDTREDYDAFTSFTRN